MKNWKTSVSGIVAAVGMAAIGYVIQNPLCCVKYPWMQPLAIILAASGVLGNGLAAKDSTTHSTVKEVAEADRK